MTFDGSSARLTIGLDGDDTLWHNENILWAAEKRFENILLRYVSAEDLAERLYETEMRNLSLFGYGAKGFVLSMIETAIDVTGGEIKTADIKTVLGFLKEIVQHPVDLIDGARETLGKLSETNRVILISKGELFHQEQKIASSGLAEYFESIEIVPEKEEKVYAKILHKHEVEPSEFVMVGNSLRSDIDPVLRLGGHAIHVPYEITWKHEEAQRASAARGEAVSCCSLRDVVAAIRTLETAGELTA